MSERPRLYLIDGYSNVFRAYYAIRDLSNSKGEATNAVFGFLQMLRKLLRSENPEYIGVAFDVSSQTLRRERYADYKAHRAPMPDDLRPQIPWIRRLIEAYRIPLQELASYEADDVLGTLAKKAVAEGFDVVLVSPDKDLMQLVGDGIYQYHPLREKLYDARAVEEDFGVPPAQVRDVLALMGDTSDNVPGVPGIGEKGAKQLIAEYGSLEALLEHAGEIKRKTYREGLLGHRDAALLSKELVTIHTDLPIDFDAAALRREEPDYKALLEICWELDFQSLVRELEALHGPATEPVAAAVAVTTPAAWQEIATPPAGSVHVAAVGDGVPLGLAVIDGAGRAIYADFRHPGLAAAVRESVARWFADPHTELVGHDLKEVLRLLGVQAVVGCRLFDTMLASYLLRPDLRSQNLDDVALERLHQPLLTAQQAGWVKGAPPAADDPRLLAYAGERVLVPQRLAEAMRRELATESLERVYHDIEAPLVCVLMRMEEAGVLLDVDYLADMSRELAHELEGVEEGIYRLAGERFNLNSPQQLGEILFEKLGYPVLQRTRKTRSYSTGAETLEELAARGFPLPEHLLRYRELSKLKSTYVDALPLLVAADGRLHTRFNQAVAATGRLSSVNPNLQNIPIRTELGHRIRRAFRAEAGANLVVADYSQIELRVLAHIAEEEAMIEAFRRGDDIHAATAAAVFGVAPALVTSEQRRVAKTINFGILYGMSGWGLARRLGIGKKEAEQFIAAYLARYPGVARYTRETLDSVATTGRVETLYGRIRLLPDIRSRNYNLRENAKRMAINARIQGTAADILKLAMIAVDRRLEREHAAARLLLTVHDELVLEAPESDVAAVSALVREEMEGVAELRVPLVADVGAGETWFAAKG